MLVLATNFLLLHTLTLLQDLSVSTPQLFGTFKALPVHVDESLDEDEDCDHSLKTPGKKTFMESMLKAERISHDSAAVTAMARSHVDIHLKVEFLNFDNFLESHYNTMVFLHNTQEMANCKQIDMFIITQPSLPECGFEDPK